MNEKFYLLFFVLTFSHSVIAQDVSFLDLGTAEKWWAITHPSSAIKAKAIGRIAIQISDSIAKSNKFPNQRSGGEEDAIRHAVWMAILANSIGEKKALKLGEAHEKGNYRDFKKGRKEEGHIPDLRSVEMDLFNNKVGVLIYNNCNLDCDKEKLLAEVMKKLYEGELKIIKMDMMGNSLDNKGKVIPRSQWEGKWENNRILAPSNYNIK